MIVHKTSLCYAEYYLNEIEGNIDILRSITAEQNHVLNVKIISQGGSNLVVEQISVVFSKNQYVARNNRKSLIQYMSVR